MTDLETRLQQALKADSPSPRDPMFRAGGDQLINDAKA